MGKRGHQSTAGKGEKEEDGSPRDTALYCKLPKALIKNLKEIAKQRNVSLTDLISEALHLYLKTLKNEDT